uniref:Uncharacterized protein n=2 Tax=Amniota TaxID=32524 RepID=A0A8D0FYB3_STROC
MVLILGYWDIR